jgi:hypothetical protein
MARTQWLRSITERIAALLRSSLGRPLPHDRARPWMRFAGMIESGRSDSSRTIDDVVYAGKR